MSIEKKIVFPALVFISMLAWVFFANTTGITLQKALLLEKIMPLVASPAGFAKLVSIILSANFLLALFLFPLPFVFAGFAATRMNKATAMLYCTAAAAAATIIALIVFPFVSAHLIVFFFYVISFPVLIDSAELASRELKRLVVPRAISGAVGKANIIVAIGLFIASAMIVMPNPEYVQSIEKALTNTISTQELNGQDLTEIATNQQVQMTKQSFDTMTKNPLFEKLRTKEDLDVKAFVAQVDAVYSQIDSNAFREAIMEQVKGNQEKIFQSQDFSNAFQIAKKQIPMIQQFEEMLWLFEAIIVLSIFLPLSTIVFKPVSMLLAFILDKLYPDESTPATNQ